jgi:predicted amidohydrolase
MMAEREVVVDPAVGGEKALQMTILPECSARRRRSGTLAVGSRADVTVLESAKRGAFRL